MSDQLSKEKERELKEIFDHFDKQQKGYITPQQLEEVMRALGANPTKNELLQMMKEVDKDKSNKIEFEEFLELFIKNMMDQDVEEDLIEVFKLIDKEGKGTITSEKLSKVMAALGEPLLKEEAEEFIRAADPDGDGYINYHEFIKIMMTK